MSITVKHGRLTKVDSTGNVDILYPATHAIDVVVDPSQNSFISTDITNLNSLINQLGKLAFQDAGIETSDFSTGVIYNDLDATEPGKILDARAGKKLNDHFQDLVNGNNINIVLAYDSNDCELRDDFDGEDAHSNDICHGFFVRKVFTPYEEFIELKKKVETFETAGFTSVQIYS